VNNPSRTQTHVVQQIELMIIVKRKNKKTFKDQNHFPRLIKKKPPKKKKNIFLIIA
jgi:hypothetical protein